MHTQCRRAAWHCVMLYRGGKQADSSLSCGHRCHTQLEMMVKTSLNKLEGFGRKKERKKTTSIAVSEPNRPFPSVSFDSYTESIFVAYTKPEKLANQIPSHTLTIAKKERTDSLIKLLSEKSLGGDVIRNDHEKERGSLEVEQFEYFEINLCCLTSEGTPT